MAESDAGEAGERAQADDPMNQARGDMPSGTETVLTDFTALASLIIASFRDAARLLGLETLLVVKTVVMMVVFGVVLGVVLVAVWLSITVITAVGLYEYTAIGLTGSVALASLLNVAAMGTLLVVLRRLARRLTYPETRMAVRSLMEQASQGLKQQE